MSFLCAAMFSQMVLLHWEHSSSMGFLFTPANAAFDHILMILTLLFTSSSWIAFYPLLKFLFWLLVAIENVLQI